MADIHVDIDRGRLANVCERYHIKRVALFGSALRSDFTTKSDVDVLIEFDPSAQIGWDFVTLRDELQELLGRPVDLLTPNSIRPAYRQQILSTATDIYVAAR